jgi:hypothetical protein
MDVGSAKKIQRPPYVTGVREGVRKDRAGANRDGGVNLKRAALLLRNMPKGINQIDQMISNAASGGKVIELFTVVPEIA